MNETDTSSALRIAKRFGSAIVPITSCDQGSTRAGVDWAIKLGDEIIEGWIRIPISSPGEFAMAMANARKEAEALIEKYPAEGNAPVPPAAKPQVAAKPATAPVTPPSAPPRPVGPVTPKPPSAQEAQAAAQAAAEAPAKRGPGRPRKESPPAPAVDQGEPGDPSQDPGGAEDVSEEDEQAGDRIVHFTKKHKGKRLRDLGYESLKWFAHDMTEDQPGTQTLSAQGVGLKEDAMRYLRYVQFMKENAPEGEQVPD